MYEALANAFDELGVLSNRQLSQKDITILCQSFTETINQLTEEKKIIKSEKDNDNIIQLCKSMEAAERIVTHIFSKQAIKAKN